jgi:SAM-dependent methyltransferase
VPPPTGRGWRRLLRAPAVRAALLQLLALPLMLSLAWLLDSFKFPISILTAALLQGALAAFLSRKFGLAPWWTPIQLLFPVALLAVHALHAPSWLFLAAFVFLLGLYWSTFRTQVPFYPSGPAVWAAVADLLPADRALRMIDVGSGLGGLVLHLAARRPESHFSGIELAPLPWLCSRLRARLAGSRAAFIRGDYEALDFSAYDAVFAYLSPAVMAALWAKASTEMRPGAMLFSYEFAIEARAPDRTLLPLPGGPALYVWYF